MKLISIAVLLVWSQFCSAELILIDPGFVGEEITSPAKEVLFTDLNGIASGGVPLDLTIAFDKGKHIQTFGDVVYRVELMYSGTIDVTPPVPEPSFDQWNIFDQQGNEIPLGQSALSKAASLSSISEQRMGMVIDTHFMPGSEKLDFYGLRFLWETAPTTSPVTITGGKFVIEPRRLDPEDRRGRAVIAAIPEPSSIIVWSLIGLVSFGLGRKKMRSEFNEVA